MDFVQWKLQLLNFLVDSVLILHFEKQLTLTFDYNFFQGERLKAHVMTTHDTITQQCVLSIGRLHILSLAYTEGREDRRHPGLEHEQAFTSFRKISTFAPNIWWSAVKLQRLVPKNVIFRITFRKRVSLRVSPPLT